MAEDFETIRYETDGAVATITMNRPDVANAQNSTLIDEIDAAFDLADADDAVRVVILAGRRQALLLRPRPQGAGQRRRVRPVGGTARDPRRQVPAREDDVLRPLPAHPRLPQADHRRRAGQLCRGRADAGRHVRPDRRRRRRRLLQPGPAPHRGRRRAPRRAVGARDPQGQGVPAHRRHHRRPGGVAPRPGQPGRPPGRARRRGRGSWPTGSRSSRRSPPRRSRTPSTRPGP